MRVTASNSLGSASADANATAVVQAPAPQLPPGAVKLPSGQISVPVSSVALPARLILDGVQFSPNPVRSREDAITLRVHVSDMRGFVVRDALVFARSTPLLTTTSPEQRTGEDGWVTLQLLPQAEFPLRTNHNVQFFVRVRKDGDNILAGVTTSQLIQVATAG